MSKFTTECDNCGNLYDRLVNNHCPECGHDHDGDDDGGATMLVADGGRPAFEFIIYRCTECGKLSESIGALHGHIERHRPIWRFWQSGQIEFLRERTEVLKINDYDSEPLRESSVGLAPNSGGAGDA